jgi:subtilase family serine protease/photosystem II stability/assembly factor-like uncharacterized protein
MVHATTLRTFQQANLTAAIVVVVLGLVMLAAAPGAEAGVGQWTSIGPEGGVVSQVVVAPTTPPTLYIAAYAAGLFKSTDRGDTWAHLPLSTWIRALAVDPTAPDTLYAGEYGHSLWKTTNGGTSWTSMHWFPSEVWSVAIDPHAPGIVYVGTASAVYKSTDGGATWGDELLSVAYIQAVAALPTTPTTVLAATNYGGLYWSTNGGVDWNLATVNGGPSSSANVTSFTLHPTTAATVYAAGGDAFRSTDGGATWTTIPGVYTHTLAIDPTTPTTLYAGSAGGANSLKSIDDGATWTPMTVPTTTVLAVDPETPATIYAGTTRRGMFKSTDAGDTWAAANSGLTAAEIRALAVDPVEPSRLYAASYYNGLFLSADRGATWRQLDNFHPAVVVVAPSSPSTVYAGGCNAGTDGPGMLKRSTDGGDTWVDSDTGIICLVTLTIDPTDPATLYAGTYHGLMKSIDGGQSWTTWSATAPIMRQMAVDPMAPATMYATTASGVSKSIDGGLTWAPKGLGDAAFSVAVVPGAPSTVYVGNCGGGVWKSTNGGDAWEDTGRSGCVYALAVGPGTPAVVYAAVWGQGVYATSDGGDTWQEMVDGLGNLHMETIATDPAWPSRVYAGTAQSVFEMHTQPAPTLPDLVVTTVGNPPATVAPGGSFAVTDTVKNQGAMAAGTSATHYYFSTDTARGTSDVALSGSRVAPALAAGEQSSGGTSVTLPSAVTSGTYYLLACADDPPAVAESDETNNCRASTSTVTVETAHGIDLVTSQVGDLPATAGPGARFSVTETVKNQGTATAGMSRTRHYLSLDGVKDATDIRLASSRLVPSLAAGATSTGTVTVALPTRLAPATYHLLACADDLGTVAEWNETNNCLASTGTLVIAGVDLHMTAVSNPPATASMATRFTVTDTVVNEGGLTVRLAMTRYYLSADMVKDDGDFLLSGARFVQNLSPGATSTGTVTLIIGMLRVPGRYHLLACADANDAMAESDEANNCLASATTVEIPGPDLVVTAVGDPPATARRGTRITVGDTLQNIGTATAIASRVSYYLSVDAVKDSGDVALNGVRAPGALSPGATSTGAILVIVPSSTTPGVYSLLACAAEAGIMAELDVTNNCRPAAGTITISP